MIVPVNIELEDIDVIKQAVDDRDNYYDWTDTGDVGDAIEVLIQTVLPSLI